MLKLFKFYSKFLDICFLLQEYQKHLQTEAKFLDVVKSWSYFLAQHLFIVAKSLWN